MQPLSRNQRPDLPTYLMEMSLVLCLPRKMHLCRSSSNVPHLPSFLRLPQHPHVLLTFGDVGNPSRLPRKKDSWTSKSGPNVVCLWHFDFHMCFTPQLRALFEQLNVQKYSEHAALCHFDFEPSSRYSRVRFLNIPASKSASNLFWLGHALRPTGACSFWSLLPEDGSAPAALASLLFDPPEPHIIGKTRLFYLDLLSTASLFSDSSSPDSFSSLTLPTTVCLLLQLSMSRKFDF